MTGSSKSRHQSHIGPRAATFGVDDRETSEAETGRKPIQSAALWGRRQRPAINKPAQWTMPTSGL
jgi:hypothetical protein